MAMLNVHVEPPKNGDGTAHSVRVDVTTKPTNSNGDVTFDNLTTGYHLVYVCGTYKGRFLVSGVRHLDLTCP